MAKASRSSKKQPAFDPSELKDLIFSPAVGTGVGSHLLPTQDFQQFPASTGKSAEMPPDRTTVVTPVPTTVDRLNGSRSGGLNSAGSILKSLQPLFDSEIANAADLSTEGTTNMTTVGNTSTVAGNHDVVGVPKRSEQETSRQLTVDRYQPATVDISDMSAVDRAAIEPPRPAKRVVLWVTEQGDLVAEGRVKRIRLAQDVINSAEESVYDTLWTAKVIQTDDRESSRVVQAGYDYLVKRTRLSKKTIQRIVAKLIAKDFIAIERPADIYQRTSTVYRVFSYKTILERHVQKGRSHVAKMGPGFSYVRIVDDPRSADEARSQQPVHLSTVDNSQRPTVGTTAMATEVNQTTDTVPAIDQSTVVRETTIFRDKNILDNNTSSSSGIYQQLSQYGAVDDAILDQLIKTCKQQAADCTDEEIIHFIQQKGSLIRVRNSRIYNPIGFLITAVPKCFSGEAFRLYREEQRKRREAEAAYEAKCQAELDEWRREQEARLLDPEVSEQDKKLIRECLGTR